MKAKYAFWIALIFIILAIIFKVSFYTQKWNKVLLK